LGGLYNAQRRADQFVQRVASVIPQANENSVFFTVVRASQRPDVMRNVQWARWSGAFVVATLALAGCASEVGSGDPTSLGSTTESTTAGAGAPEARVKSGGAGRQCSPLECCFPTEGGGWQDNVFDDRLRALGCSTPAPYEESGDTLWAWSECPFELGVIETVFKYSSTPYDAHFVENPCLGFHPGSVDVVFDPTCPTCIGIGIGIGVLQ
jgi:hypothetical protein